MIFALGLHFVMMLGEVTLPSPSEEVRHAVRVMTRGALGKQFWFAAIALGTIIPVLLLILSFTNSNPLIATQIAASISALLGLLAYEYVWITAGQAAPLS
jgi:formate-dependent nitrite reductase membrane component NrfD